MHADCLLRYSASWHMLVTANITDAIPQQKSHQCLNRTACGYAPQLPPSLHVRLPVGRLASQPWQLHPVPQLQLQSQLSVDQC